MKIMVLLMLIAGGACAGLDFEVPPVLQAAAIAPETVPLKGELYAIDADVPTDGLLATFTIRSDFGRIEVRGPGLLRVRVAEVQALARLKEMQKLDIFADSLKKSATALGGAVVNVATNPGEVAKGVPAGVGRFFERTARQVKTAGQKVGDAYDQRQAESAAGAASTQNVVLAAGSSAGRTTRDILGYDEKRRDLARQLGVDPYTTNPLLKKELDDVAWAAFAGGLGVDMLASKVPGARLIQSSSLVSEWIYSKSPGDLKVWIEKTLKEIGVGQDAIDQFLRQPYWTLTLQTALVESLGRMAGVEGRAQVVDTAVTVESADQARFLALGLALLAREHKHTALKAVLDGKPIGMTRTGRVIVTVPVDYVSWTERVARFATRKEFITHQPTVVLPGKLSPRSLAEMKQAGWEVREGSSLAGVFDEK